MPAACAGTRRAPSTAAGAAGAGYYPPTAVGKKDRDAAGGMLSLAFRAGNGRVGILHRTESIKTGITIKANVFVNRHC
jgi:hypothetical protein